MCVRQWLRDHGFCDDKPKPTDKDKQPDRERLFDLWRQQDAEIEEAKARVARVIAEVLRTQRS